MTGDPIHRRFISRRQDAGGSKVKFFRFQDPSKQLAVPEVPANNEGRFEHFIAEQTRASLEQLWSSSVGEHSLGVYEDV